MKLPYTVNKTQNEALTQSGGMDMFTPLEEFACQVSRSVDAVIIDALDKKIGPGWELEKVEMEVVTSKDPTEPGTRYKVKYDGEEVGTIRHVIAVQGNKAIGNLYVEMEEKVAV